MPIKNDPSVIQAQIHQALQNNVLSRREADRLLTTVKKDGVTEEEVKVIVDTLKAALAGSPDSVSMDVSSSAREKVLNHLMGRLHAEHPVPLEGANGPGPVNWLKLMTQQSEAKPVALPDRSFGGKDVGIDANGQVVLGGKRVSLQGEPTAEMHEALWTLNKPNQTDRLDDKSRNALTQQLLGVVQDNIGVANDAPGKYKKLVAVNAAAGALADVANRWDAATVDKVLDFAGKAPNPMIQSLLLRGLGNATLSPEQKTKFDGLSKPENSELLLKKYDELRNEMGRIDYSTVKGETAQLALSAMTFAKSDVSIENIENGMKTWKGLNQDYSQPWDREEVGHMNRILEAYVDKYPQTSYVYGTFSEEAPREIGNITNQRAVSAVAPKLDENPPSLQGFPLTREQADYVKTLLPNVRDESTIKNMVRSLATADAMFGANLPSSWGEPTLPQKPMSTAAFEQFKTAATSYQETVGSSKDGKLDYNDFQSNFREHIGELQSRLKPRLAELNQNPPQWGEIKLSPETASFVKQQLMDHTRSTMSVDNLGRALQVFANAHGGSVEGAASEKFQEMVQSYKNDWPGVKTFDFNKLERIASFKVQGKEVPLCTINGQTVGLAEFYGKVGTSVAKAIDPSQQSQPWMPDRWGYRAKEAVELLDVVAEKAARNEGPVALLKERYPGKQVEIQATGRDGAHDQFLYVVKDGNRQVGVFAQGSDGTVAPFQGRNNPVLFTATVGQDGQLNVNVPTSISVLRYPLQTTYSVGDKVDVHFRDNSVSESQKEGEAFSAQARVLEGQILGFDAKGNYEVQYTTPKGEVEKKSVPLADIRRANNPHYFKPKSSYFSDVTINLQTDKELAEFLKGAQPIIDSYLPADGSTVTMSAQELAKRQKDCIKALMEYTHERVKYPADKESATDDNSKKYHELVDGYGRFPLGELVKIGKGVCRHQCILEHLLLQQAGIESRLASGAANTSGGNFRGYHIWTEVTLADNQRYLSDQTWDDAVIPLWEGAYSNDKRRIEMYDRTARYDSDMELSQ